MGNYTSCCFKTMQSSNAARVVDSEGNIRELKVPVKAGELMIEEAGKAVCLMKEMKRSGKVVAVKAETGLLEGEVYMLVGLSRVHCRVSESEMKIVNLHYSDEVKASRKSKRRGSAKVIPAVGVESEGEESKDSEGSNTGLLSCRLGNCKHWTPVLEPILEEL